MVRKSCIPLLVVALLLVACDSIKVQSGLATEGDWQFSHPDIHDARTEVRDHCMGAMFRETKSGPRFVRCSWFAACQTFPARSQITGATETQFCQSIITPSA